MLIQTGASGNTLGVSINILSKKKVKDILGLPQNQVRKQAVVTFDTSFKLFRIQTRTGALSNLIRVEFDSDFICIAFKNYFPFFSNDIIIIIN